MSLEELFDGYVDVAAMMARMRKVAAELKLPFGDRTHTYNSRNAQELGKWAEQQGQGLAFQDAVYRAYFVKGLNISQPEILTALVADLGMDADQAEDVLRSRSYSEAVDADWQRSRAMGITAVPSVLYGNRKLVGFRPYEDFRKIIIPS